MYRKIKKNCLFREGEVPENCMCEQIQLEELKKK
jgi:hypothetical protein